MTVADARYFTHLSNELFIFRDVSKQILATLNIIAKSVTHNVYDWRLPSMSAPAAHTRTITTNADDI